MCKHFDLTLIIKWEIRRFSSPFLDEEIIPGRTNCEKRLWARRFSFLSPVSSVIEKWCRGSLVWAMGRTQQRNLHFLAIGKIQNLCMLTLSLYRKTFRFNSYFSTRWLTTKKLLYMFSSHCSLFPFDLTLSCCRSVFLLSNTEIHSCVRYSNVISFLCSFRY